MEAFTFRFLLFGERLLCLGARFSKRFLCPSTRFEERFLCLGTRFEKRFLCLSTRFEEHFLCLSTRFEELRAQALNEPGGVIEQVFPVVDRQLYYSTAAKEKVLFVVASSGLKRCRQGFLVTAQDQTFP